jgi:hypothetical protein
MLTGGGWILKRRDSAELGTMLEKKGGGDADTEYCYIVASSIYLFIYFLCRNYETYPRFPHFASHNSHRCITAWPSLQGTKG